MASLDSILDTLMPWIVGFMVIGFIAWCFRNPLKYIFKWAIDLAGYGKEKASDYVDTRQIAYQ